MFGENKADGCDGLIVVWVGWIGASGEVHQIVQIDATFVYEWQLNGPALVGTPVVVREWDVRDLITYISSAIKRELLLCNYFGHVVGGVTVTAVKEELIFVAGCLDQSPLLRTSVVATDAI